MFRYITQHSCISRIKYDLLRFGINFMKAGTFSFQMCGKMNLYVRAFWQHKLLINRVICSKVWNVGQIVAIFELTSFSVWKRLRFFKIHFRCEILENLKVKRTKPKFRNLVIDLSKEKQRWAFEPNRPEPAGLLLIGTVGIGPTVFGHGLPHLIRPNIVFLYRHFLFFISSKLSFDL